jgi:hypothetical protein
MIATLPPHLPYAREGNSCLIAALTFALLNGCSEPVSCSNVATPSLRVNVANASGKAVCDVMVHAEGPTIEDEFDLNEFDCSFVGGTRDGTYEVTIVRGAEQLAAQMVTVESDACGPVTRTVTITIDD